MTWFGKTLIKGIYDGVGWCPRITEMTQFLNLATAELSSQLQDLKNHQEVSYQKPDTGGCVMGQLSRHVPCTSGIDLIPETPQGRILQSCYLMSLWISVGSLAPGWIHKNLQSKRTPWWSQTAQSVKAQGKLAWCREQMGATTGRYTAAMWLCLKQAKMDQG